MVPIVTQQGPIRLYLYPLSLPFSVPHARFQDLGRARAGAAVAGARVPPQRGPHGTEALKNLVLGGIGEFTIVDGSPLGPHDLGNSFLADEGAGAAQGACGLLSAPGVE